MCLSSHPREGLVRRSPNLSGQGGLELAMKAKVPTRRGSAGWGVTVGCTTSVALDGGGDDGLIPPTKTAVTA